MKPRGEPRISRMCSYRVFELPTKLQLHAFLCSNLHIWSWRPTCRLSPFFVYGSACPFGNATIGRTLLFHSASHDLFAGHRFAVADEIIGCTELLLLSILPKYLLCSTPFFFLPLLLPRGFIITIPCIIPIRCTLLERRGSILLLTLGKSAASTSTGIGCATFRVNKERNNYEILFQFRYIFFVALAT